MGSLSTERKNMSGYRVRTLAVTGGIYLASASGAFALFGFGDIVFDPTLHGWHLAHESKELIHWAEEIKKFEDFLAQQIKTIESVSTLRHSLVSRLGDWQGVYDRALSLRNEAKNLKAPIGGDMSVVAIVDYGKPALVYSNRGLYAPVTATTAYGTAVALDDSRLKRYQSVFALHEDAEKSAQAANREIGEVLTEIAATSREIVGADSQEKLAKLQEKRTTLQIRLTELQRQLETKLKLITLQATVNQNRAQLEREVKRETVKQTFQEARERDAAALER